MCDPTSDLYHRFEVRLGHHRFLDPIQDLCGSTALSLDQDCVEAVLRGPVNRLTLIDIKRLLRCVRGVERFAWCCLFDSKWDKRGGINFLKTVELERGFVQTIFHGA